MDTDRERDIASLEVHEENRKLVEEFLLEKLGKRAKYGQGRGNQNQGAAEGGAEGGTPAGPPAGPTAPAGPTI